MFYEITYESITKMAIRQIVASNAASLTLKGLDAYTDVDTDSTAAQVGAVVVGQLVAMKAQVFTNAAVDAAFGAWRARKKIAQDIDDAKNGAVVI